MKHYRALITVDGPTQVITSQSELVNDFSGSPLSWTTDAAGKISTEITGAFPIEKTFTRGTCIRYDVGSDNTMRYVAVDRTSDNYIEVTVQDGNEDMVDLNGPIPVEFFVHD